MEEIEVNPCLVPARDLWCIYKDEDYNDKSLTDVSI